MKVICPHCQMENEISTPMDHLQNFLCWNCNVEYSIIPPFAVKIGQVLSAGPEKIRVACPYCGQHYAPETDFYNTLFNCQCCNSMFLMPSFGPANHVAAGATIQMSEENTPMMFVQNASPEAVASQAVSQPQVQDNSSKEEIQILPSTPQTSIQENAVQPQGDAEIKPSVVTVPQDVPQEHFHQTPARELAEQLFPELKTEHKADEAASATRSNITLDDIQFIDNGANPTKEIKISDINPFAPPADGDAVKLPPPRKAEVNLEPTAKGIQVDIPQIPPKTTLPGGRKPLANAAAIRAAAAAKKQKSGGLFFKK